MNLADAKTVAGGFHDLTSVTELKYGDQSTEKERLHKVAKEFETLFVNEMLKSARKANEVLAEDNPLNSEEVKTFQGMLDNELALSLGRQGKLGIADMLVRQFGGADKEAVPPSEMTQPIRPLTRQRSVDDGAINNIDAAGRVDIAHLKPEQTQFVKKMAAFAKGAADRLGVPVSHIVAQAVLESGWGQHVPKAQDGGSSYNFFGIKASNWDGDKAVINTQEFKQGLWVTEEAAFRAYGGMREALDDYANFIERPRYQDAINNPDGYFEALQQGGYATDPSYADKARSVLTQVQAVLADNSANQETGA